MNISILIIVNVSVNNDFIITNLPQRDKDAVRHLIYRLLAWADELSSALGHLHRNRVLHRDLKAQNVFLTLDQQIKLGDFGVSRVMSAQTSLAQTIVGTPFYMSPEVMRSEPYASASDPYAVLH